MDNSTMSLEMDSDEALARQYGVWDTDPESFGTGVDLANNSSDPDSLFDPKSSHGHRKFAKEDKKIKESNEAIISRQVSKAKDYIDSLVDEEEKIQKRTEVTEWINKVARDILAVDESKILYKEIKVRDEVTQKQVGIKCQFIFTSASIIYEWDQNSKVNVNDAR